LGGELWDHLAPEQLPLVGVAPELGDVDRDAVEEGVDLGGIGAERVEVGAEGAGAAPLGERPDAALHLRALVLEQVDAAEPPDPVAEGDVLVVGGREAAHRPPPATEATAGAAPASAAIAAGSSWSGR